MLLEPHLLQHLEQRQQVEQRLLLPLEQRLLLLYKLYNKYIIYN
jgi:hypothetical protein